MRRAMIALGSGLVMGLGSMTAMAASSRAAVPSAAPTAPAGGLAWCGFKDKPGSRVRCGYSSESDCRQAVGGPAAICIVDPYLTERRRARADG